MTKPSSHGGPEAGGCLQRHASYGRIVLFTLNLTLLDQPFSAMCQVYLSAVSDTIAEQ